MNKNGFTLIEVLFVLGIVSVLLLLSAPLNISTLEKLQDEQFLQVFEFDVLSIQSKATTTNESIKIILMPDRYKILVSHGKPIVRPYPTGWKRGNRTINEISFNKNGALRNPGSIQFTTKNAVYVIIFPLGKGRFYIVKK